MHYPYDLAESFMVNLNAATAKWRHHIWSTRGVDVSRSGDVPSIIIGIKQMDAAYQAAYQPTEPIGQATDPVSERPSYFGVSLHEVTDDSWFELVHEDEVDMAIASHSRANRSRPVST